MRRGEVLGLRWRDLDFETGTVRLSQTVQTDPEHGWVFTGTKTHRSRVFYLPPFVLEALRAHRKAQNHHRLLCGGGWVDHDLVIDRGDGSPMRPWALSQRFHYAMEDAGIDLRFHDLRARHEALCYRAG